MLPRAALASHWTPVEPSAAAPALWVKRDDLSAALLGGNKVRALEFLLAGVAPGDEVLTVGGTGSTHALATTLHAQSLGARTTVVRWRQEMNEAARAVARRIAERADRTVDTRTVGGTYLRVLAMRLARRVRWVPAGGTTPLGILGHVSAALEVAEQIAAGAMPAPARVVLPLGSGGTMAGLALGFAMAGVRTELVGVRVVPWIVANARRVRQLADRTARLVERHAGTAVPRPAPGSLRVAGGFYGGAYGRETAAGREAAARFAAAHPGVRVDATYSAKALAAALAACDGRTTLFWMTFDGRWME